jgi:DNA-binding NarL/FixJ family response regulator
MTVQPGWGSSVQGRLTRLRGRRSECAVLDAMIAAVHEGESRTLVVCGDAGVGKTALLEYASASALALELRVLRAVGEQSEMELTFAALHQLCAPMLDHLVRLPSPQREALRIVFGLSAGPPPDRFLVGLAVLSLVSEAAQERPMLCVVDDSQWLDQGSARTLGFVARRLRAQSVALVFAGREPSEDLRGLSEVEVQGLGDSDARALLGSAVGFRVDERVRDRIVAETGGNPLALLELPRGLSPTQLAGGFGLLEAQPPSGRIEDSFLRRLDELPQDARLLLLVAAADPVGDPLLMWRAAERLGLDVAVAASAETEGLLAIGERVTFRHPLVRSAVYRSASAQDRRSVHLALAEVTDPETDPDRRAWHRAAAAPAPDEEVATDLERTAGRAQARGGLSAAAAFLQRSVALTAEPARRADRALAAAQASLQAGAFDVALGMLATAQAGQLDELQGARVDLLRGQVAFASGLGADAPPLLLKAAKRLEGLDLELARETYLNAWGAAVFAGPAGAGDLLEVCRAASALPEPTDPPRPADLLLDGLALMIAQGRAAAAPTLRRATSAFAGGEASAEEDLRWGWVATAASNAMWDDDGSRAICTRQIQVVRDAGALGQLPIYLVALGTATAWSGDFAAAASLIAEADEVRAATGTRIAPYAALLLSALRGSEAETCALIEATISAAADGGQGIAVTDAQWVAAVLYNGLGRPEQALAAAQQACSDPRLLFAAQWALPELVEAATRCGKSDLARDGLRRLALTTQPAATEFGLGIEARCRALLSEGTVAEDRFHEAIDRLSRTRLSPEVARAHLLYGEWLRRQNRRVDARAQLRTAHKMFTAMRMDAFAERARRELLATGETVRKRNVETPDELTPQERQIALLARDGLSNPEVGARLFISPRTVEWHLRKVFAKLAISSRRELRNALRGREYELVQGA